MSTEETALWQRIQREVKTRPDGEPGIATARAIIEYMNLGTPAPEPAAQWPRDNDAEMEAFYGKRGENTISITPPYQLFYDGKPTKTITVHRKIAPAVLDALTDVLKAYGAEKIKTLKLDQFDGCLNVRLKRGGSTWSVHSWAAALDFNAEDNTLSMDHTKARFAKPEYEAWFRAWEKQGAVSLGRERDYDWMHIQFARL